MALVLILQMLPFNKSYAQDFIVDNIAYILDWKEYPDFKTVEVWGYVGPENTDVAIPETVEFQGEILPDIIEYPEGTSFTVTGIYADAFAERWISTLLIPATVTKIADNSLLGITDYFLVDKENPCFCAVDGVLYNKEMTTLMKFPYKMESVSIPNTVTTIGKYAFAKCGDFPLSLPESVEILDDYAFSESQLVQIILPDGVKVIGNNAFLYSNINFIELSESLIQIGEYSFSGCSNLSSITIPGSVETIGDCAFINCGALKDVEFSQNASLEEIGSGAFWRCYSLQSIILPNSLLNLGNGAFQECKGLVSVTLSESLASIEDYAFTNCSSLTSIELPNSLESMGQSCFESCSSLKNVTFGESLTEIPQKAFSDCSVLSDVSFSSSLEKIDDFAFYECDFKELVLPENLKEIGSGAFDQNSSLSKITTLNPEPPSITGTNEYLNYPYGKLNPTFSEEVFKTAKVVVPDDALEKYKTTYPWTEFSWIISAEEEAGVTTIEGSMPTHYKVYDLNGMLILKTSNKSELNLLPKGLYIINGKKIIL